MIRILYFTVGLSLASLFLWYVWKILNNPRKNNDKPNSDQ
jgi:hypothetical protein